MSENLETALRDGLRPSGLALRGGFVDGAEELPRTLFIIGNRGGDFWPVFRASGITGSNALDDWTRSVLDPLAEAFSAKAIYPFDQPPPPFLTWAAKADPIKPSPLGLLIDPDYGLWHAYRAVFVVDGTHALTLANERPHPCDTCASKPCLTTCPVGAFTLEGYDVDACRAHVNGPSGAACRNGGCLARQACPVGPSHVYSSDQQRFHMDAFRNPGTSP
ncbi:MAG: hypothetical protein AAGE61_10400 [Pseudomonadota bacterium]